MKARRCATGARRGRRQRMLRHRDGHSRDENAGVADDRLRFVEKTIQGRDFTCMRETVNATEAWLGGLPGQAYANVRQPPISTLNLAHIMPLSAVWAGPERDADLAGLRLFFARTEGSTPFRFSLHVGDVGQTLIVGPTGGGKSVLLALMALQFRRYTEFAGLRLRLRRFDPRRGARHGRRLARPWRRALRGHRGASRPAATRPYRRRGRARLGVRLDRRPACPRIPSRSRPSSRSVSGRRLTSFSSGSCGRADDHRPLRPPAVECAEAGASALHSCWSTGPPARRRVGETGRKRRSSF